MVDGENLHVACTLIYEEQYNKGDLLSLIRSLNNRPNNQDIVTRKIMIGQNWTRVCQAYVRVPLKDKTESNVYTASRDMQNLMMWQYFCLIY